MDENPPTPVNPKRRNPLLWILLALAAAGLGWMMRPYPQIDQAKVHPALRGLDGTEKCAWTSIGDGGTLCIWIWRSDGSKIELLSSNSLDHSFSERGQLYLGGGYFDTRGTVKISGYDHTKFLVATTLANSDDPENIRDNIALITKRPMDWVSFAAKCGIVEAYEELRLFE